MALSHVVRGTGIVSPVPFLTAYMSGLLAISQLCFGSIRATSACAWTACATYTSCLSAPGSVLTPIRSRKLIMPRSWGTLSSTSVACLLAYILPFCVAPPITLLCLTVTGVWSEIALTAIPYVTSHILYASALVPGLPGALTWRLVGLHDMSPRGHMLLSCSRRNWFIRNPR